MSSPETAAIAALAEAKNDALAKLQQTEATVFRFSHRVRAFLAAWPDDMPTPVGITPTFNAHPGHGSTEPGSASYLHFTYMSRQGVEAWAARWGTDVVCDVGAYSSGANHVFAEGTIDGLRVVAAFIEYASGHTDGAL